MTTEQSTGRDTQPRDPDCFEQWLCERLTTTGADEPEDGAEKPYSWESWNRFFNRVLGSEQTGYEVDEDDHPIDGEEADDGLEEG